MSKLDLDYFENVLMYKSLTDGTYLASVADFVQPEFFKSKAINDFLPNSDKYTNCLVRLPLFNQMELTDSNKVIENIQVFFN